MLYDIHNVSDLAGHARVVIVRHVPVPVGSHITLPGPLPRELSMSHVLTGVIALAHGEALPSWVVVGRTPTPPVAETVVVPEVKAVAVPEVEVVVPEEPGVDYAEFRVSEMALLYKEVTGRQYRGRRRRTDLIKALSALDQQELLEAIG